MHNCVRIRVAQRRTTPHDAPQRRRHHHHRITYRTLVLVLEKLAIVMLVAVQLLIDARIVVAIEFTVRTFCRNRKMSAPHVSE